MQVIDVLEERERKEGWSGSILLMFHSNPADLDKFLKLSASHFPSLYNRSANATVAEEFQ